MKMEHIKSIIKDNFLSGLLILAPILIVGFVVNWFFGGIVGWIENVPLRIFFSDRSSEIAGIFRFIFIVSFAAGLVILVSGIGFFSRNYFGHRVFEWVKEGIEKIPLFGPIYASLDQLFQAISSSGGKQFSRVVYFEYPRKGIWSLGFVTGQAQLKGIPPGYLSIFVPTVPNPTSGFHLMVSETEVVESGLKVDEAFKLILSLGVAMPHVQTAETAKKMSVTPPEGLLP